MHRQRAPWEVLVGAGTALAIGLGYAGARLTTPTTCAALTPYPGDWTRTGVLPHVSSRCPLRPGTLVTDVVPTGAAELSVTTPTGPVTLALEAPWSHLAPRLLDGTGTMLFPLGMLVLTAFAVRRRPQDRAAGWLLVASAMLLASTVAVFRGLDLADVGSGWQWWLYSANVQAAYLLSWGAALAGVLLIPRPAHPRLERRGTGLAIALTPLLLWLVPATVLTLRGEPFAAWMRSTLLLSATLSGLGMAATLVAFLVGTVRAWRTPADPVERQQALWFGSSGIAAGALTLAFWVIPQQFTGSPLLPESLIGVPGLLVVAGLGVSMFRYRLFDLDTVLARTVVYAVLTLGVVLTYLVTTAVVALLFAGLPDSRVGAVGAVSPRWSYTPCEFAWGSW